MERNKVGTLSPKQWVAEQKVFRAFLRIFSPCVALFTDSACYCMLLNTGHWSCSVAYRIHVAVIGDPGDLSLGALLTLTDPHHPTSDLSRLEEAEGDRGGRAAGGGGVPAKLRRAQPPLPDGQGVPVQPLLRALLLSPGHDGWSRQNAGGGSYRSP